LLEAFVTVRLLFSCRGHPGKSFNKRLKMMGSFQTSPGCARCCWFAVARARRPILRQVRLNASRMCLRCIMHPPYTRMHAPCSTVDCAAPLDLQPSEARKVVVRRLSWTLRACTCSAVQPNGGSMGISAPMRCHLYRTSGIVHSIVLVSYKCQSKQCAASASWRKVTARPCGQLVSRCVRGPD